MNENRSPIPSRLYNAAKGGHVAGTADIIDDNKGKTQDVINKEIDNALENRYTKNETYSKTELNNLITTPEQQYVTLTAQSGDTLEDIFNGIAGAANTVYRVGSWDGNQYNTTKYAEYGWNGTNFVPLDVKEYGIDDEPTAGSENLVRSGGITEKIYSYNNFQLNIPISTAYVDVYPKFHIVKGTIILNKEGDCGALLYRSSTTNKFVRVEYYPHVVTEDMDVVRSDAAGNMILTLLSAYSYTDYIANNNLKEVNPLQLFTERFYLHEGAIEYFFFNKADKTLLVENNLLVIQAQEDDAVVGDNAEYGIQFYDKDSNNICQYNGFKYNVKNYINIPANTYNIRFFTNGSTSRTGFIYVYINIYDKSGTVKSAHDALEYSKQSKLQVMPIYKEYVSKPISSITDDLYWDLPLNTKYLVKDNCLSIGIKKDNNLFVETAKYNIIVFTDNGNIYYRNLLIGDVYNIILTDNIQRIRVIIYSSQIINIGLIEGNVSVYANNSIAKIALMNKNEISKDKCFRLKNRLKNIKKVNNVRLFERPQTLICSYKSFIPALNFNGNICFEGFTGLTTFDTTKPLLFEEHTCVLNVNWDGCPISYISEDFEHWAKYDSNARFNNTNFYTSNHQHFGITANSEGVILTTNKYNGKNVLIWSLDGGKTFEPAVNTLRASVYILANTLTDGTEVVIDNKTYHVMSASDIFNGFSSSATTIEERKADARNYLNNKIILTQNTEDVLRSFANVLINDGYKVRIEGEGINIYYKEIGIIGNGKSFTIGGNLKTFSGAKDLTNSEIIDLCCYDFNDIQSILYKDGTAVNIQDIIQPSSLVFVAGFLHIFIECCKGGDTEDQSVILDIKINNYKNVSESTHYFSVLLKEDNLTKAEPIASVSKVNNDIIVGLRNQKKGIRQTYLYSLDNGTTWSNEVLLPDNIDILQGNLAIFHVPNAFDSIQGKPLFYDIPNANTSNMYVALIYDRKTSTIFAATAKDNGDIEHLSWSDFVPLNRTSDELFLSNNGFEYAGLYTNDYNGLSSIGGFCYSPLHRCLSLLYTGLSYFVNSQKNGITSSTYCFGVSTEEI